MKLIVLIPLVAAIFALGAWLVQVIWNAVVPDVFTGVHTITFFQAALLMLLSNLLIRSSSYGSSK